jgi:hypothetical protein
MLRETIKRDLLGRVKLQRLLVVSLQQERDNTVSTRVGRSRHTLVTIDNPCRWLDVTTN